MTFNLSESMELPFVNACTHTGEAARGAGLRGVQFSIWFTQSGNRYTSLQFRGEA